MTRKQANIIADLWNEKFAGCTEATKTRAQVAEPTSTSNKKMMWSVEIRPEGIENTGDTFYHTQELGYMTDAFKVSSYVTINDKCVIARLY